MNISSTNVCILLDNLLVEIIILDLWLSTITPLLDDEIPNDHSNEKDITDDSVDNH